MKVFAGDLVILEQTSSLLPRPCVCAPFARLVLRNACVLGLWEFSRASAELLPCFQSVIHNPCQILDHHC